MKNEREYFYLFPSGDDFTIRKMKQSDARKLWEQGHQCVAYTTRFEAELLRKALLEEAQGLASNLRRTRINLRNQAGQDGDLAERSRLRS